MIQQLKRYKLVLWKSVKPCPLIMHTFMLHQPKFGRRYSKMIVYDVCINLQTGFVGVASSFARMYTSRLKVKQKAKIVNCRWAGFFWELLVCLWQNRRQYHGQVTIQPLLKNLLAGAALVWPNATFFNSWSSLVPELPFHAWSTKLESDKACLWMSNTQL